MKTATVGVPATLYVTESKSGITLRDEQTRKAVLYMYPNTSENKAVANRMVEAWNAYKPSKE